MPTSPPEALAIAHVDSPTVEDGEALPHDPVAALDKLTQLNGPSATTGANACGAFALVAATLVGRGYAGLARLVEGLEDELSDETSGELARLAGCAASGGEDATYGTLAVYADVLHKRYRGEDGGMPYDKLLHLMRVTGFQPPSGLHDDDIGKTIARTGQCWPAKIALDGGDEGDHWILVGRSARGLFLYDPYPREDGSQIVRPGETDWKKYAELIGQREDGNETIGFLPAG